MQSAYADYMRAAEVFENSRELTRDLPDLGRYELTLLDCRRDAFEHYLEARVAFLECRFDEIYRREAAVVSRPTSETGSLRTFSLLAGPKWLVPVLAGAITCAIAFSFVREHKHVRDLDLARDQLRAGLSDAREQLQFLTKQLDARQSTDRPAVGQVEHAAEPPARPPSVEPAKPSAGTGWRRVAEPITKVASHSTYFSLSRPSQAKRVGPLIVSLKSVDVRRNSVDLSIVSESGKVDIQHLRLNQPVRIKRTYHGQLLELEADRITANGISGHLIEFHG